MSTEQMSVIFPASKSFTVNGESVIVGKIKLRQVAPIIALAKTTTIPLESGNSLEIVAENLPMVAKIFSILTDKPEDFYADIDLDVSVDILQFVIEQNQDLFVKKILPLIKRLTNQ